MKGPPSNKECAQAVRLVASKIKGNDSIKRLLIIAANRLENTGHTVQQKTTKLYTVYDNRTDQCLAFELPASKCAEALGITVGSFYSAITRGREKWTIIKKYADELDIDTDE